MLADSLIVADGVVKRFADRVAVDLLAVRIERGRLTGLVGPDGAGKTTLLRLFAGLLLPSEGTIHVCGFDTRTQFAELKQSVAYMPQQFGLYEDLTVRENLDLYADLRGVVGQERDAVYRRLLAFTALAPFTGRLAGRLSGGMKQKLGLACALVRPPRLLLLDEPSVGVDPISRRELWAMVYELVEDGIGVVWSTAYLDEAERCASVLLLSDGRLLYDGPPQDLTERLVGRTYLISTSDPRQLATRVIAQPEVVDGVIQGGSVRMVMKPGNHPPADLCGTAHATPPRFEDAFIDLLGGGPKGQSPLAVAEPTATADGTSLVEAQHLTKRFGTFTAVDGVSFEIARGEIFGLLGPNGAGKSTTFKMLCGLLHPTSGSARVAGHDLARAGSTARSQLGYMAQKFSLYGDLSVRQNLDFFSGVYGLSSVRKRVAIERIVTALNLGPYLAVSAGRLPLGFKRRLSLACAILHDPPVLFLDEPTSGVDPLTRREFWTHINALVVRGVTVLVTTHFLDEAEYCDRIGLVYQGRVIAEGSPDDLKTRVRTTELVEPTLEDAFISLVNRSDSKRMMA